MSIVKHCGSCNAEIIWLKHVETGKPAPIDWLPHPKGNIVITPEAYRIVTGEERERMLDHGIALHSNHFMTCRNAQKHRDDVKRKKQEAK